jgi:tetratricopeptide (TPR) repeat protein
MSRPKRKATDSVSTNVLALLPPEIGAELAAKAGNIESALRAAEYLSENGPQQAIVKILAPLQSQAKALAGNPKLKFALLLGCGLCANRKYAEAEDILESESGFSENDPDRDFLLVEIKYALREYQTVVERAERYLKTVSERPQKAVPHRLFRETHHRAQVLTWLGEACAQLDRDDDAFKAFSQAVDCAQSEEAAYIGLARTLVRLDRREEAAAVISRGITNCPEHQELVMLREYLLNRPRISACMIVKDEEKLLPECLLSIRDWVDEIVLVDTGSSDRTREIAQEFGARVIEQPWSGDFSHHRNFSIEQASGDWIFIIDADERFILEDVPTVIDAMRAGRFKVLSVGVFNVYGRDEERRTFCNSYRFFRRDLNLRYTGIVHNALELPPDVAVLRTTARIKHLGYDLSAEQMSAKFERTRALLQKQLSENPDDVFALFNYSELLRGVEPTISEENASEILRCSGRVTTLVSPIDAARRHLRLMALNQSAVACLALKDYHRALGYCEQALALRPDYLDALFNAGLAQYGLRDFNAAITSFQNYCRVQADFDAAGEAMPIILSYPDALDFAHNSLGALYEIVGQPNQAIRHYLQTMEKNPRFRDTAGQLGRLYAERGEFEAAERWYRHQLTFRPTQEALTGLASVLFQTGRFDQAESHYRQAIAQFGASWAAENDLGNCLYKQSRYGEAEQHYLRAAELNPDESATYLNLALAQTAQGRRRECIATLEHYIQAVPGSTSGWQLIAEQFLALGSLPEAQACFENALRLEPHNRAALLGLSDSYLLAGQRDAAALGYRQLLQIDPAHRVARERLESIESSLAASAKR